MKFNMLESLGQHPDILNGFPAMGSRLFTTRSSMLDSTSACWVTLVGSSSVLFRSQFSHL